jgi:DnaJ-class molecular chaperone
MRPVWSYVMTLIGGVVLAIIVAVVLAFRIGTHSSNMSVSTANHIVWGVFLAVFAIGTLRLIWVLRSKDSRDAAASKTRRKTTNTIDYSRSSRASSWTAQTTNTIGSKQVERCGSCSGSGKQTCFACGGGGRIKNPAYAPYAAGSDGWCAPCTGSGRTNCNSCGGSGKRR